MPDVRTLVLAAVVLVVVGVSGALATLALAGPITATTEEWALDAAPVRRIEIDVANAAVDLFPASGGQDHIQVTLTGRRGAGRADVTVDGDILRIRVRDRRPAGFLRGHLKVSLALPERAYAALHADLANGDFSANRLKIADIRVRQRNGRIRLESVQASRADLGTRNGNIALTDVEGQLAAQTRNGFIEIATGDLAYPMNLVTTNGNIRLETGTPPANATLELSATNGSVTVFGARRGSSWRQVFGNGNPVVEATTGNGNIVITD